MKKYAVKNTDNSISIVYTDSSIDQFVAEDQELLMEVTELPDRDYRDCWRYNGSSITVHRGLAEAQVMSNIRDIRDAKLLKTDAKYMEILSKGEDDTAIKALKDELRDLPASVDLSELSLDEMKELDAFAAIDLSLIGE